MRGAGSLPSRVTDGTSPTDLPWDTNPILVDCFRLGAHVCAAVVFLVVRLIWIGQIDVNRLGVPGSVMGTDRVCPHHLIGVDWAQNQSR